MKIVSTGYTNTTGFSDPVQWLGRISFYTGILEELAKTHEVHSIEQISYRGELEHNKVIYHFLNHKKPRLYFPGGLHSYIKQLKPDVVLVNGLIFPLQVIQLRLKLGDRIKIILFHRSEKPFSGIKKQLQRLADKYVDAYLFTSSEFGEQWAGNGNIDQKKIHEVMHGSSVFHPGEKEIARSMTGITGSPVFLWVGRLNENKDPLTVLKAFGEFVKQQPGAMLYMIYQEEDLLREVKEFIDQHELLSDATRLVGKVSYRQLQAWYNSADFIISGSHYEGGGIAICEAMSCGCIPVVTDIISFRKMTGPGKCGFLYKPGDDTALLKILEQTIHLDKENEKKKVLKQFKEELSFEAIGEKINRIIGSL